MKKFLLPIVFFCALTRLVQAEPLKVYIMAGQSNMQGHANISTFEYMKHNPKTVDLYNKLVDKDGKPLVCKRTWISYVTDNDKEYQGKLTVGFGAKPEKLGPEFSFGVTSESMAKGNILIIKTAWGGRSLHTDFRPPGAGPGKGSNQGGKERVVGLYYKLMMEHVKKVLADPKKYCPEYDPAEGLELAGFVWFQGYNDLIDTVAYPNQDQEGGYDEYTRLLAQLIRDVRKELNAPKLRFVIGVNGTNGPTAQFKNPDAVKRTTHFRQAMAAPAAMDEFKGTVKAVWTEKFYLPELGEVEDKVSQLRGLAKKLKKNNKHGPNKDGTMDEAAQEKYIAEQEEKLFSKEEKLARTGISNAPYHYLGAAAILAPIGDAFAKAMMEK